MRMRASARGRRTRRLSSASGFMTRCGPLIAPWLLMVARSASLFMDDGFGSGPPAELFTAFISFVRDLKAATGCRVTSAECYSPDYDLDACPHRRAAVADLDIPIEVAGLHDQAGTFHRGFTVLGAPIGEPGFESMILNTKADKVVGAIDTTVSLLRHVDTAALGALVYYTLQSRYDYWLQHCSTPTAIRPMVVAVDTALLTALSVSQAAVVPTILDPLILRRIRLPPTTPTGAW